MANARNSNPSRIGKTLGAILSAPRRGAADDADEADAGETVSPPVRRASEPDAVPGADPVSSSDPVRAADASTTDSPTTAPAATTGDEQPGRATPVVVTPASTAPPSTPGEQSDPAARTTAEDAEIGADLGGGGAARRKKRETFLIPEELADAMRNAIVHLSGPPLYYTLAEFGEHAIRSYIAQLEREHNAGHPFPPRPRAVRQGRPLR